jgi:hypothetical protein
MRRASVWRWPRGRMASLVHRINKPSRDGNGEGRLTFGEGGAAGSGEVEVLQVRTCCDDSVQDGATVVPCSSRNTIVRDVIMGSAAKDALMFRRCPAEGKGIGCA